MVAAYHFRADDMSGLTVDDLSADYTIAVDGIAFACEMLVFNEDVERVRLFLGSSQFATQVGVGHVDKQLVSVLRIVCDTIVAIIVDDAGACAERNLPVEVGEEVESVVMVMLCDGEFRMKHHPMDEVRELAHASTDAARRLAVGDSQPFSKSTTFGVASHKSPE